MAAEEMAGGPGTGVAGQTTGSSESTSALDQGAGLFVGVYTALAGGHNAMNTALSGVQRDVVDWTSRLNDTNAKKSELREVIAEIREAIAEDTFPVTLTVEGRPVQVSSRDEAEKLLSSLEEEMQTLGDDAQMQQLQLQDLLQKQTQILSMMTNLLKVMHETCMAVIRNLKG